LPIGMHLEGPDPSIDVQVKSLKVQLRPYKHLNTCLVNINNVPDFIDANTLMSRQKHVAYLMYEVQK